MRTHRFLSRRFVRIVRVVLFSPRLLMFMVALASGACGRAGEDAAGGAVRVALLPYPAHTLFLIAEEEGLYREVGVNVELVRIPSGTGALPLLLQGEIDVLPTVLTPGLLNAIARGSSARIVGVNSVFGTAGCTEQAIVRAPSSRNTSGRFRPRRISTGREPFTRFFVDRAFSREGLRLEDSEVVQAPRAAESEALRDGGIDAAFMGEPWLMRALALGSEVWVAAEEAMPGYPYGIIAFSSRLVGPDAELGRRLMTAFLRAAQRSNAGPTPKNLAAAARTTGLSPETLGKVCWPRYERDLRGDLARTREFQRWAVERGYLDRELAVEEFWTPAFVEYALQQLDGGR